MFIFQIIISFVVGGLFIAFQTLLGERVPLYWRGTVLTLPSTMAISFLFIGLTKSADDIVEVAVFFPAALSLGFIFVVVFALLSKHSLWLSLVGAYATWTVAALAILKYPPHHFVVATFLYALPIILLCYLAIRSLPQVTTLKPVPWNYKHIIIRSLIGGSIIVVAVILSKTLGNIWGSLFSAFPAVFSATLLIYTHVHGKAIIPAVGKSLFFPGPIALILYAGVAGITFPRFGIWFGTILCYLAVLSFYSLRQLIGPKLISKSVKPV